MSKVLTSAAVLAWLPRLSILPSLQSRVGHFREFLGAPQHCPPPQREAASAVWRLGFWGST